MRSRTIPFWFTSGLILLIAAATASGQIGGSGTIQGTVTDPSDAVIAGAAVSATNVNTGVITSRQTTEAGFYVLAPLPPGRYNVKVSAPGFRTVTQEGIVVDALATIGLDLKLALGETSEQVTVEATASALHTDDVVLGQTMQNVTYEALPLAMGSGVPRDPTQFIALSPGVAAVAPQAAGPSYTSFNGSQAQTTGLYLEGLAVNLDVTGDTRPLALGVSVEAVEQFQVEVNGEKAQYQGQGFHNYQLKSGTNRFHGAAYEYFRNTDMDARGFFSPFVPVDHQNEFGGLVSGPIKKNKIFFFGNYTGYYYDTSTAPIVMAIPSVAFRNGNLSALPVSIYDPASAACAGAICSKQPFPGNMIPASRISSVSKSFQSYLPSPTNSGIVANYLSSLPRAVHNNNTTEKVDWNLSDNHRLYGVFVRGKWITDYTGNLGSSATANPILPLPYTNSPGIVVEVPTIGQLHYTFVRSPLVNNFSVSFLRLEIPELPITMAGKYPEKAGLTGLPPYGRQLTGSRPLPSVAPILRTFGRALDPIIKSRIVIVFLTVFSWCAVST